MATKVKSVFFCQSCGYESSKWMGQCPGCREWNTFVEEAVKATPKSSSKTSGGIGGSAAGEYSKPMTLAEIVMNDEDRADTRIGELTESLAEDW